MKRAQDMNRATHGATGAAIAANLREEILAGTYAPGERIRQDELADRHGASRLPVRDALRILEAEGLVSLIPNTGAWVSRISMAECQEMYRMRERLEPLLVGMNVPLLSSDDAEGLELLAGAMESSTDVEEFLRLDRVFHLSCLQAVETSVLGSTVLNLWNRTQHYRRAATRLFYLEEDRSVHHDHHLIVNAIRQGDADEAEQVLARHIRRSRLELARHPEVFR
ncbi:GntR family transcriptional regulator [Microbacterium sp. LWS13-1.2]|uniref:GntR family transcriptional regulator n=2 Tax=Microbacterium sp. LWS13-1.2 TaxID=3135264 RepID=A0AAU6SBJ7_9MICO